MQKYYLLLIPLIFAVIISGSFVNTQASNAASLTNVDAQTFNTQTSNNSDNQALNSKVTPNYTNTTSSSQSIDNTALNQLKTIIISGIVTTCNAGDPFKGVTVYVMSLGGQLLGTTTTNANGIYKLMFSSSDNVFQVTASYPGHTQSTKNVTVNSDYTNPKDQKLYGNADFQLGTLVLNKGTWDVVGVDSNSPSTGPYQSLIQIIIQNTGSVTSNIYAYFNWTTNSSIIGLANGENATRYVGNLQPGQNASIFYLIQATKDKTMDSRSYTVNVWGDGVANTTIAGNITKQGLTSNNAAKVNSVSYSTSSPHVNDTFNVTMNTTLNNAKSTEFLMLEYDPALLELMNYTVTQPNGTVSNMLYIDNPGNGNYITVYTFKSLSNGSTQMRGLPIGQVSANNYQYNKDNYTSNVSVLPPVNIIPSVDLAMNETLENFNLLGQTPRFNDIIRFNITVSNYGPSSATGVNVTDLLPAGLTYLNHTISTDGGISWTSNSTAYNTTNGNWTIGNIPAYAVNQFILSITAKVTGTNMTINNTAKVSGNEYDRNNTNNASSIIFNVSNAADISVTKIIDKARCRNGTTTVWPPVYNCSLYYYVTLHNNGPNNATGIVITDILPANITYANYWVSEDSGTTWKAAIDLPANTYNATTGIWNAGDLNYGAKDKVLSIRGIVKGNGTWINNTATKTAENEYDWNVTNDNSSANVYIPPV